MTLHLSHPVFVVEVSTTGAKLEGRALPESEESLWLKIGQVNLLASVAWRTPEAAGIRFDDDLSFEQLAYLRQEARGATISTIAMQDWDSGWAR